MTNTKKFANKFKKFANFFEFVRELYIEYLRLPNCVFINLQEQDLDFRSFSQSSFQSLLSFPLVLPAQR